MKKPVDAHFRRDLFKLAFLLAVIIGGFSIFAITPALSTPILVSIIITMFVSPLVAALERRGYPRTLSIMLIFGTLGVATVYCGLFAFQSASREFDSLKQTAPKTVQATIEKMKTVESSWKTRYPALEAMKPTQAVVNWVENTWLWAVKNGTSLAGNLLTCLLLVPFITFVLLHDGRRLKKYLFELVPNRFFESVFIVTNEITSTFTDYIRAKSVEAFLVGLMTTVGLWIIGAPYAIVFGAIAGITNILPYIGPIVGAIPGILFVAFDPSRSNLLWPIIVVYSIANIVDTVFIFPVVVAKLINLHPLLLIIAVMLGQRYYGLVGMLLSVPIAAALKIIMNEIHVMIYKRTNSRSSRSQFSKRAVSRPFAA